MADDLHDSYRILQLEPGAALPSVKRSYRQLVKTWHPDHFAPGSAMEIKAQEKLKEINLAYEKLCKNKGMDAAAEVEQGNESKKARKPAASSDDEEGQPKKGNSRKAEEEPISDERPKPRSRKVGDLDDEEPRERRSAAGTYNRAPRLPIRQRLATYWKEPRNRRRLYWAGAGAALVLVFVEFPILPQLKAWIGTWAPAFEVSDTPKVDPPPAKAVQASHASALGPADIPAPVKPGIVTGNPSAAIASPATLGTAPSARLGGPQAPTAVGLPVGSVDPEGIQVGAIGFQNVQGAVGSHLSAVSVPTAPSARAPTHSSALASPEAGSASTGPAPPVGTSAAPADPSVPGNAKENVPNSPPAQAPPAHAGDSAATAAPQAPVEQNFDTFTVGSTKDEVVAVQGKPDGFSDTDFQYGSSHVTFNGGRVVSWQDGSPRLKARKPTDLTSLGIDYFTVGSRKDEVVSVQGKPDRFSDSTYEYGKSAVFFKNDRVVSWINASPHLKARVLAATPSVNLKVFTVGSRKDEVVVVQGLPDQSSETTFTYGTSVVRFENGRVVSWISGTPALRVKKP